MAIPRAPCPCFCLISPPGARPASANRKIPQRIALGKPRHSGYGGALHHGAIHSRSQGSVFTVLWFVFFIHGMVPGFWVPALTNILTAQGLAAWVPAAFMIPPLCALVGPLVGGAIADQRMPADRLFLISSLLGGVFLAAAFGVVQAGWHPAWFLVLLGLQSVFSGPGWSLLASVSLANLDRPERNFPLVRVGATVGWVAGGMTTGYLLGLDNSPWAGQIAAVVRVLGTLLAFRLPHTPPLGQAVDWRSRLGFDAFRMLRRRNPATLFGVTTLFSIPLTALYMYGPEYLKVLGDPHPTGTMTVAQVIEVAALLGVGAVMSRFPIKAVLLSALGLSVLRYGLSALSGILGGIGWHIAGIAFHGVCYAFFFITAQVFLERSAEPAIRNQAQGLLAMLSGGLGPLAGAPLCAWLRHACVTPDGQGWELFWLLLGGLIALCFVIFAVFYQEPESGCLTRDGTPPSQA